MRIVLHEQECKVETAQKHERPVHSAWFQSLWVQADKENNTKCNALSDAAGYER